MAGGRAPRAKGDRFERRVVAFLRSYGHAAHRVPMSGALAFMGYPDDVVVTWRDGDKDRIECKKRGAGFANLYRWLEECSAVIIAADRREPLIVLRLGDYAEVRGGLLGAGSDDIEEPE